MITSREDNMSSNYNSGVVQKASNPSVRIVDGWAA